MTGTAMSFGETLAKLRRQKGMTQPALAPRAGVPLDNLRRWEQDRHLPRVDDAYKLATALGVGVEELVIAEDMAPEEEPPPPKRRRPKGGGA